MKLKTIKDKKKKKGNMQAIKTNKHYTRPGTPSYVY